MIAAVLTGCLLASCTSCGGAHLSKLEEDVTETLEVAPHCWEG